MRRRDDRRLSVSNARFPNRLGRCSRALSPDDGVSPPPPTRFTPAFGSAHSGNRRARDIADTPLDSPAQVFSVMKAMMQVMKAPLKGRLKEHLKVI